MRACLPVCLLAVSALCDLCAVEETYPGELSTIARQGSGSSCRSLYGGFVKWEMGTNVDGSDSRAVQVADETHWPEIEALILVVSDQKKETGSTRGMDNSVRTSTLLDVRCTMRCTSCGSCGVWWRACIRRS